MRAGAGIDAVSGGEIYRALLAHTPPEQIVFAGVGKTGQELYYARRAGHRLVQRRKRPRGAQAQHHCRRKPGRPSRVALRLNPDVTANTHPQIATGHGGAKFGLTADAIRDLLARQDETPNLRYAGIHVHIGSQLHDTDATLQALRAALDLIAPYPQIRTINLGGGLPVAYSARRVAALAWKHFAAALLPLLDGYELILEPGRAIIADAGTAGHARALPQGTGRAALPDRRCGHDRLDPPGTLRRASRDHPAQAGSRRTNAKRSQVVGPVCETTDMLARQRRTAAGRAAATVSPC